MNEGWIMKTLTLDHEKKGPVDVVILDGLLNADTSVLLETLFHDLAELEQPQILMNMENLSYISSAGIGCFIGSIKKIRSKSGDIRFSSVPPKVKRVFFLLDMVDFFKFFDTVEEGLTSYEN